MPEPVSYGRQIGRLAAEKPDQTAVVHAFVDEGHRVVSRQELDRRSNQVARLLADRGVGQGDLIAVALPNSAEHFFTTYGAWKLGATVLPMRWDLPSWEQDRLLNLARPALVVSLAESVPSATLSIEQVRSSTSLDDSRLPDRVADPARAMATSGSTGSPKIIIAPGPGTVGSDVTRRASQSVGLRDEVTQLVLSPLYHTNGFACHNGLLEGQRLIVMERFDAARAVDLIEQWQVNYAVMVPTMLLRIARLPGLVDRDFSSIDAILYGGAPIPRWVVQAWFELVGPERFFFSYGGTEGHGLVMTRGDEWLKHEGTVGRPIDCEIRILDEEGRDLPAGEVGEIFLRRADSSPSFRYVGAPMPEPSADGFRSFGDLGWLDEDGYLYIADRRVDLVVSGGANVYPAEVEVALSEHAGVADAVVIGLPDPEWGRRVHALIEPADGANPPTDDDLRAHCRARLAGYKVPKSFEIVARLPRTAAGKINRSALVAERSPTD
jgi:bile acid-coenzyme A ligase